MSKAHKQQTSRATRFTCHAPSAQAVFLAGAFNGWDPKATPMAKDAAGDWGVAVDLPRGTTSSSSLSMASGAANRAVTGRTTVAPSACPTRSAP